MFCPEAKASNVAPVPRPPQPINAILITSLPAANTPDTGMEDNAAAPVSADPALIKSLLLKCCISSGIIIYYLLKIFYRLLIVISHYLFLRWRIHRTNKT